MTAPLDHIQPQTEAGIATAEDGLVILDGPDGVAVTMTAHAASQTGQSLLSAARLAEKQQKENGGDSDG